MKAIEAAGNGDQVRPLRFEHLPHGPIRQLGMLVHFGVSHALIEQPGVQLVKALHPRSRREEPFAHQAHLVLDLPLFPARRRRAGGRLHRIMAASFAQSAG